MLSCCGGGCWAHCEHTALCRTHQIRVHMAASGHPVIGDPLYGAKKDRFSNIGGQCLHAAHLTLTHPETGEQMRFDAPLPDYFTEILGKLEKMT